MSVFPPPPAPDPDAFAPRVGPPGWAWFAAALAFPAAALIGILI